MALAGGVNLILAPEIYIALSHSRMLAPDGRCKTFDAAADGFARGEGCGVVVLKRLSDAQTAGDRILALIRSSAVNQDGPSSGLTAPNGPAQESLIREALARAGLRPSDVGYIEAHGTGTQLGDPLEVRAIGSVFADRGGSPPLMIGSVKTNVGHLEGAAGVTDLVSSYRLCAKARFRRICISGHRVPISMERTADHSTDRRNQMEAHRRTSDRRRELIWIQWHQCACHRRGGTPRACAHGAGDGAGGPTLDAGNVGPQ